MQEIEKILEEFEGQRDFAFEKHKIDAVIAYEICANIVRKHLNDGWIPVKERLPKINKVVLTCMGSGAIDVAWHDGHRWKTGFSHADWITNVTAWRPLPEPYRPGKDGEEHGRS